MKFHINEEVYFKHSFWKIGLWLLQDRYGRYYYELKPTKNTGCAIIRFLQRTKMVRDFGKIYVRCDKIRKVIMMGGSKVLKK